MVNASEGHVGMFKISYEVHFFPDNPIYLQESLSSFERFVPCASE